MSTEDKQRWERKYATSPLPKETIEVVEQFAALAKGKIALDIACGMGRNSKFMAQQGFTVDALDISPTAIASLESITNISAKEVDFDTHTLKKNSYDLIVCTYFLKRELFPQIIDALKEKGIFIFETFMHHPNNTKAPSNRSFLLEKGELEKEFGEKLKILHLHEFWKDGVCGDRVLRASMVAQKISSYPLGSFGDR